MKKKLILFYSSLGITLFIIFSYLTFPYNLIKENIVSHLNSELSKEKLPIRIEIDNMSPYWLTGVELNNVRVKNIYKSSGDFVIDEVIFRISLLNLIIGDVFAKVKIYQNEGELTSFFRFSLNDVFKEIVQLNSFQLEAKDFPLDGYMYQFLRILKASNLPALAVITPVIDKSSAGGKLNGTISYEKEKLVNVKIKLDKGYIDFKNDALGIPKQDFSTANFNMRWDGKRFLFEKGTEFISQNMSFSASGFLETIEKKLEPKQLNIELKIHLSGVVEQNFGFLIPQVLKCPPTSIIGGNLKATLVGDIENFTCY